MQIFGIDVCATKFLQLAKDTAVLETGKLLSELFFDQFSSTSHFIVYIDLQFLSKRFFVSKL